MRPRTRDSRARARRLLTATATVVLLSACSGTQTPLRRFVEGAEDQPRAIVTESTGAPLATVRIRGVLYELDGVRIEVHVQNLGDRALRVDASQWYLLHEELEYAPRLEADAVGGIESGAGATLILDYTLSRPMTTHGQLRLRGLAEGERSGGGPALGVPPRPPIPDSRKIRLYPGS